LVYRPSALHQRRQRIAKHNSDQREKRSCDQHNRNGKRDLPTGSARTECRQPMAQQGVGDERDFVADSPEDKNPS